MQSSNFPPAGDPIRDMIHYARWLESQGNLTDAMETYRRALAYCPAGSPMAQEVSFYIFNLETRMLAASTPPPPATPPVSAAEPLPTQVQPVIPSPSPELDAFFDQAMAALHHNNLPAAEAMLAEIVRRNPAYSRGGYVASALLADLHSRSSQPAARSGFPLWGFALLGAAALVIILLIVFGSTPAAPITPQPPFPPVEITTTTPPPEENARQGSETPTITIRYSDTPTSTLEITPSFTPTFTQTLTPTPSESPTWTPLPAYVFPACYSTGETTSSSDGMTMLCVPAGNFLRGSNDSYTIYEESPAYNVYLDTFWIDQTEVTNQMFAAFLNARGNQSEGGSTWYNPYDPNTSFISKSGGSWVVAPGHENAAVSNVSWYGAYAYCAWTGKRLPSEAEWEKAARGTDGRIFPWGNTLDCSRANVKDCGYTFPRPVKSYPSGASPYGAYDMIGNAWEWVNDWYLVEYYQTPNASNPSGPATGDKKVLRGGSWTNPELYARASIRGWSLPYVTGNSFGFRCAANAGN